MSAARALSVLAMLALLVTGCARSGPPELAGGEREGPLPSYAEIRDAHNARVELLDRLWTRTVVRVDYKNQDGEDRSEQLEGHLQFAAPQSLLMTFHKLGELYFIVGSNDDLYWWIQLGDDKQASVGRYERAEERAEARVQLPVHPLDFISLLAIRPLPEEVEAEPTWAPDTSLVELRLPARWGERRMLIDPETLEPARVELIDEAGEVAAAADLTRYMDVAVERDAEGPTPRVPQRFWVSAPKDELSIKVDLYGAETNDEYPRARDLDFERLIRIYRVDEVTWVDETGHARVPGG